MKVKELRELSDIELKEKGLGLRRELLNLRFQLSTTQLSNTARIPQVKKEIARIKTILNERSLNIKR